MSNPGFMSMRWLRLHIKEIIWATVLLFVGSIFVIGYGTSRQIKQQEERKRKTDESEAKSDSLRNSMPQNLREKANLPVVHVSYPAAGASLTTVIDVKSVWRSIKDTPEYQQLQQMPEGIREFYGNMLKEKALESLVSMALLDLFARAGNIQPAVTAQALVESDRQQISPMEFDRKLRQEGLTAEEYGNQRLRQITFQAVAQKVMAPVPPASATDDFLKNYYETNKDRFKEDDQISFSHLLLSPADFAGKVEVNEEQIKSYFDANRGKFISSRRFEVSHIFVNHHAPEFLAGIAVSEKDMRSSYSENLDKYRTSEKVQARHILIKPRNNFDHEFASFKVNLRNFASREVDGKTLFVFDAGIANIKAGASLDFDAFALTTADGKTLTPDATSMQKAEEALELPFTGASKSALNGQVAILADIGAQPATLTVKDGATSFQFAVDSAFDEEKAFAAAKTEIDAIAAKISAGEDFATLAGKHSEDTGSAKKGGDLGEFARGSMVKPFEDAAFSAVIGKVTEPVRSQFGYHIIKVENKIPEKTKSFEEVKEQLAAEIKAAQAELKASSTLETAKQKVFQSSDTFVNMVKLYSSGASRKTDGLLPVFFTGEITEDYSAEQQKILRDEICDNGGFISKEIETALAGLEPGEMSDVIQTASGFHLFKLEKVLEPVQLALTTSLKKTIRGILELEGQNKLAQAEAEKIRAANPTASVAELAKIVKKDEKDSKNSFGPLPISANPGFSSYALADGAGQISDNGRTYLPEIHKQLLTLVKDNSWQNKVAGPFKSELGWHFIEVTAFEGNRYEKFEDIKAKLKRLVTLEPAEEDLQKEFAANKDQFDVPATRKIRQIVVAEEKSAQDIYTRLGQGEIFALLASKFSVDGSATHGGLLAPVKRGQLSEELDKAVWALNKGQFTAPIHTPYGYVIAMLEDNETPGVKASLTPEVTSQLKKKLRNDYQEELWSYFIKGLSSKAYVVRHPEVMNLL
ncbi:MAG TPA: peptidylprolyl isomerase [Candidatus Rifleibacterium sp.]|nr:peptidylprolyl isomerase [Candidatus Rifleibacterium sp.]HPT46272.1 peptidylprolyl isomerase [Candidatus Rifleibacterium sp.]